MAQLNSTTVNGDLTVSGSLDIDNIIADSGTISGGLEVEGTLTNAGTAVSLAGHTHSRLTNNYGDGGETLYVHDSGYYFLRPSNTVSVLGSSGYPWYNTHTTSLSVKENASVAGRTTTGDLTVSDSRIVCTPTYSNTTTYATNMYVGTSGMYSRTTNTSSRTIKHDISDLTNEELLAENLYDLPVHQFKYNDGIITDTEDARYNKDLVGFIIEEMNEIYPIAVDKPGDDAKEWSWNAQYLIPPMLKLIQDQKAELDALKEELQALKETK